MGCLFADMLFIYLPARRAVSVEMNQKQVIVVDFVPWSEMEPENDRIDGLRGEGCESCHWPRK